MVGSMDAALVDVVETENVNTCLRSYVAPVKGYQCPPIK